MASISLDSIALEQLNGEQKALLDTIDQLRQHGIHRFVDLPQIIVVGDQNSGKSSVLEAISRVRFPVKDGLCTRFATELLLRTSPKTKIDVTIQPSSSSAPNEEVAEFNAARFDEEELPEIIERAKTIMVQKNTGVSEDVLRIEIWGPDVPRLSLVDLPGFYHGESREQSAIGREVVERLVDQYMANQNSIILAILSAKSDLILQTVIAKVTMHDRKRVRTLGIITKPDLLESGSSEENDIVQLAKNLNKSYELALGWHVLRNRGAKEGEESDETRDSNETDFLRSSLWATIPQKNRGIGVLRRKLDSILFAHIKSKIQSVIANIESNVNERQTQLKRFGEPRVTPKELRSYLDNIASQFQILSLHAIEGNYTNDFFGGLDPVSRGIAWQDSRIRKLRALVRDLNRAFGYVLATKGSKRIILPRGVSCERDNIAEDSQQVALPWFLQTLADQYTFNDPQRITFEQAVAILEPYSSANQGTEFPGSSNNRIAVELFRDQSEPWEAISRAHIQSILNTSQMFVEKLLHHVAEPDKKTRSAILSQVIDPFFENKKAVMESKLQELLHYYRRGHPQPLGSEFRMLLNRRRLKHTTTDLLQDLLLTQPELFTDQGRVTLSREAKTSQTNEFDIEALIDMSEAYYEMSLRTFTENVIILAVENCLIEDLPSIFTTEMVNQMDDEELERLAAESEEIRAERSDLQEQYDALKKGLQFCNKYRERKSPPIPPMPFEMDSNAEPDRDGGRPGAPVPKPDSADLNNAKKSDYTPAIPNAPAGSKELPTTKSFFGGLSLQSPGGDVKTLPLSTESTSGSVGNGSSAPGGGLLGKHTPGSGSGVLGTFDGSATGSLPNTALNAATSNATPSIFTGFGTTQSSPASSSPGLFGNLSSQKKNSRQASRPISPLFKSSANSKTQTPPLFGLSSQ